MTQARAAAQEPQDATMPFDLAQTPRSGAAAGIEPGRDRAVALWLLLVAAMVLVMVALGGATRLTGSGLSIMEWRPFTGWFPPVSEAEWNRLFDLYRTIPQYQVVNRGMDLAGFKEIFWLEYLHRVWGRLIGIAFLAGFVGLALAGRIRRALVPRLLLLFGLGALQGFIGWFMVASGFFAHRTAVSPYRLVIHLGLAFLILGLLVWTALRLLRAAPGAPPPVALRRAILATGVLAVVAMLAGGFVAGIRAGLDYNTFPLMDGRLVPAGYLALEPWYLNLFETVATVQFNHRLAATLTLAAAAWLVVLAWRQRAHPAGRAGLLLAAAVGAQYALGVATLLAVVPVGLGTSHQTVAALVLVAFVYALERAPRPAGVAS